MHHFSLKPAIIMNLLHTAEHGVKPELMLLIALLMKDKGILQPLQVQQKMILLLKKFRPMDGLELAMLKQKELGNG